ncbi:hypothetical protein [Bacillus sp. SJS]|uniref:hypothetical protein n=1 Tax=Bacillus sp. SJS TaxID=1423321 RepID=UPI0004DCFEA5|nr:hypothetical protein [Bacillus sp. SJS]KZZ84151.1 hypothetical protein AS29_013245 [Bacillus sp. SJS]
MSMSTLPAWIWIFYYLFLLITLGTALFRLIRQNGKAYSAIAFAAALTIPPVAFFSSIGRQEGTNEWQHFISELQIGALWAVYVLAGFLYLFIWWALMITEKRDRKRTLTQ